MSVVTLFPFPGGGGSGGGGSSSALVGVSSFTTPPTSSNVDVTSPRLDGETCQASVHFGGYMATDNEFKLSLSQYVDTKRAITHTGYNGSTNTVAKTGVDNLYGGIYVLHNTGIWARSQVSRITNGINLNTNVSGAKIVEGAAAFFAGLTNAADGQADLSGSDIVITPGFVPDVVIFNCWIGGTIGSGYLRGGWGVAVRDGGEMRCVMFSIVHEPSYNPFMSIATDRAGGVLESGGSGGIRNSFTVTFDATDGFTIEPTGTDSISVHWMALEGINAKLVDLESPTSTGTEAITGVGFEPKAIISLMTALEALDSYPSSSDATQASIGMGVADPDGYRNSRTHCTYGALTSGAAASDHAVGSGISGSASGVLATLDSLDSDGFTLDWTTVQGTAKKGFAVAFG